MTDSNVIDLPPLADAPRISSDLSPQAQELLRLLFNMEPNRMAAALRMIKLFIERQEAGVSQEERTRLIWQEAVNAGHIDREDVPPEVQLAAAE